MSRESKKYLTTGEFASLCGVNKKTLFHYDNIKLFMPEKVLENGYRYYSNSQIEIFNVISALKEIGMSLSEIKTFIDNRTPDMLIALFEEQKREVDKEIENLKRISSLMQTKIDITQIGKNINNEILVEECDDEFLLLTDSIEDLNDSDNLNIIMEHTRYCIDKKINSGHPVGGMISKKNLLNRDFANYSYFYSKMPNKIDSTKIFIKPKGFYVVTYFKGYYDKSVPVYERLLKYIDDNKLNIDGYAYEDGLIDEIATKNHDDYVSKISIKVTK